MRAVVLLAAVGLVYAQAPDPAYEPLSRAYDALKTRDYEAAIAGFLKAIEAAPRRTAPRKDLAYTYLKVGENGLARDQFRAAMEIDPADTQVAMEYAFLCYETKERQQARRIFDRIRKTGAQPYAATATQAFQNIDAPLAAGIARWKDAIRMGADNFSAHFELATLAEERDELELAAEHYERAWRLIPERRSVLVDLGRVWKALGRDDDAGAALLAASRGGEPRAAESARELLPARYPYVYEFRRALKLDPSNAELQRELGFLLLKMGNEPEGEREFENRVQTDPGDLLSATQLGFLLQAHGLTDAAQPLFNRVLAGPDQELANRVRAVLRIPQVPKEAPKPVDAREMAERSIKAGYMKDALRYLHMAHDSDPSDLGIALKLGWTYNVLRQDAEAIRWFDVARKSADPVTAREAASAYRNLRTEFAPVRTSVWVYPIFSSRWSDVFGYGQVKWEFRTGFPIRPYATVRFVGDTRGRVGDATLVYLSESAFIPGVGLSAQLWGGALAWAEAGSSIGWRNRSVLPDYRAGISFARGVAGSTGVESASWFAESHSDAVFISRFGNNLLVYEQIRAGLTAGSKGLRPQLYGNVNWTFDAKRQAWANFLESGPGVRFAGSPLPKTAYFTCDFLRGVYLVGPRIGFNDVRVGLWYAFVR